ncbi:MAG: DUF1822 family protein [Crocosphaera sp.]
MTFLFAEPTQLWLEISSDHQSSAWEQSQSLCQSTSQWRVYINQLCRDTFISYLKEEYPRSKIPKVNFETLLMLWDVVNGSFVKMGDKKIILVPTEASDDEEISVPQEWIDIPSFVGDYYLAVQVNPDEQWIRIWGYTSHEKLKNQGHYDPIEKTYSLDKDDLIRDINVFFVAQELCLEETTRAIISPLSSLPSNQAENLIERVGSSDDILTRLSLPFPLWGALLENEDWRKKLYQKRQKISNNNQVFINLSRWLEDVVDSIWQSPQELNLVFETRRTIEEKEELKKRGKVINLGGSFLEEQAVILLMSVNQEVDERMGVRIQLYPQSDQSYLPSNLTLTLCSESGEAIQSVQSRSQDNYIQIKRFKCQMGFKFGVKLSLENWSATEYFTV